MITIYTQVQQMDGDFFTPVQLYSVIRNQFPESVLLESADYHGRENHLSIIGFSPLIKITLFHGRLVMQLPGQTEEFPVARRREELLQRWNGMLNRFKFQPMKPSFLEPMLLGFIQYDAVEYMEEIRLQSSFRLNADFPLIQFQLYQFMIFFDHFHDRIYLVQHFIDDHETPMDDIFGNLLKKIPRIAAAPTPFQMIGGEISDFSPASFATMVEKARYHIFRGDVFQLVLSSGFRQEFRGDDFAVYRKLRTINPSPYLFYFDLGSYHLLGSSPEAQIRIRKGIASIFPIAGTFPRSGNDRIDQQKARELEDNEKEMAEHTMLVDLARNDLNRHCDDVEVPVFHEVQFYSHVIHLVSEVRGKLRPHSTPLELIFDSFPAGTLSGAPKYRAMQLIDTFELYRRHFYGGAIGMLGLNGDVNLAIFIRSALSFQNTLYYQAGAGLVADSIPEKEAEEILNKSNAIRAAMQEAEKSYQFLKERVR